jgi:hypothetical protein
MRVKKILCLGIFLSYTAVAQMKSTECEAMKVFDYETGSCEPIAMEGMPMKMWMVHGNAFLVLPKEEGRRGRNQFFAPNMAMADIGSTLGNLQYINLNLMLTLEKWTFPSEGAPLLLQIGEERKDGRPYIDAQHPHSSPLMGLTLSDTVSLGGSDHFKIFFAPRGQATEGPVAFMHRVTGAMNPDAPLGHHTGQDVAHITSTVLGGSLRVYKFIWEASSFHGEEPVPTKVDLPLGKMDSSAMRFIYEHSSDLYAMASFSTVKHPEHDRPDIDTVKRYSASMYSHYRSENAFNFHNTFIFGMTNFYDRLSKLRSFGDEFLFERTDSAHHLWGRFEILERGGEELAISVVRDVKWVSALSLGYSLDLFSSSLGKIAVGTSLTRDFLPAVFRPAYGGEPLSGKIFIQLSAMKMGHF